MKIPVLADTNHQIAKDYGVLKEDEGIAYRGLFKLDPECEQYENIQASEVLFENLFVA